jgi:hypothetical protein
MVSGPSGLLTAHRELLGLAIETSVKGLDAFAICSYYSSRGPIRHTADAAAFGKDRWNERSRDPRGALRA